MLLLLFLVRVHTRMFGQWLFEFFRNMIHATVIVICNVFIFQPAHSLFMFANLSANQLIGDARKGRSTNDTYHIQTPFSISQYPPYFSRQNIKKIAQKPAEKPECVFCERPERNQMPSMLFHFNAVTLMIASISNIMCTQNFRILHVRANSPRARRRTG